MSVCSTNRNVSTFCVVLELILYLHFCCKRRKGGCCEALPLEGRPMSRRSFRAELGLGMRKNCYFWVSDQNSISQPLDLATLISCMVQIFWRSVGIYQHFWPCFHLACSETVIYELFIKLLTSPLDPATPIS